MDLLPSAEITLTNIIFYHTFQKRQNIKIIAKNWEWQANIKIGIVFKSGVKCVHIECYSSKKFLQEYKVLLKPDHFSLHNSLFFGLCTINMFHLAENFLIFNVINVQSQCAWSLRTNPTPTHTLQLDSWALKQCSSFQGPCVLTFNPLRCYMLP